MSESFFEICRPIFDQNWHLRPEIDSTQRAHAIARLKSENGEVEHLQRNFLKKVVKTKNFKYGPKSDILDLKYS